MGVPRKCYLGVYPLLALIFAVAAYHAYQVHWLQAGYLHVVLGGTCMWFVACSWRAWTLYPTYRELIQLQACVWKAAKPLWMHKVFYDPSSGTMFYASFSRRKTRMYLWCVNREDLLNAYNYWRQAPHDVQRFYVTCICYRLSLLNAEVLRHETEVGFECAGGLFNILPHRISRNKWSYYRKMLPSDIAGLTDRLTALTQRLRNSRKIGGKHQIQLPGFTG